jgi:hypothetical protein
MSKYPGVYPDAKVKSVVTPVGEKVCLATVTEESPGALPIYPLRSAIS